VGGVEEAEEEGEAHREVHHLLDEEEGEGHRGAEGFQEVAVAELEDFVAEAGDRMLPMSQCIFYSAYDFGTIISPYSVALMNSNFRPTTTANTSSSACQLKSFA